MRGVASESTLRATPMVVVQHGVCVEQRGERTREAGGGEWERSRA